MASSDKRDVGWFRSFVAHDLLGKPDDNMYLNKIYQHSLFITPTMPAQLDEVVDTIKNLKPKHSEDSDKVSTLIMKQESYVPPALPFELPSFSNYRDEAFQFGVAARRKHFLLEEECTFINHGAFGAVLKEAMEVSHKWQYYVERQPLRFLDREMFHHLSHVTRSLAKFVDCNAKDLILTNNATTATNTVLKSIPFKEGDVIYIFNITYGAVKKLVNHICEQTGAVVQEVKILFPVENEQQIIDLLKRTLKADTKLAIFDHIPSNTPFLMPIKELISVCHDRNVPVLVDAAHALGNVSIKISDINPDYYISNAHKWFCCPKGCAFMYVKKELQSGVRPLVVSHGFGSGFCSEFTWSGLDDYSSYLSLGTVLDFWRSVGPETMWKYMYELAKQAATMLVQAWNTRLAAPIDMFTTMALIQLPDGLHKHFMSPPCYSDAMKVQDTLFRDFNIEVPIKVVQDHLYVRISAHVYNEMAEYMKLRDAILKITENKTFV